MRGKDDDRRTGRPTPGAAGCCGWTSPWPSWRWLREAIEDIEAGRLKFALGEDWGWTPPPDDPGWQMHTDREKLPRAARPSLNRVPGRRR